MFKKLASLILSAALVMSCSVTPVLATQANTSPNFMPANEEKILDALKSKGVIRKKASGEEAQAVLKSYLQKKFPTRPTSSFPSPKDMPSPKAQLQVEQNDKSFKGSGATSDNLKNIPNATPLPLKKTTSTGKILALLVEFAQDPGPLAGNLPKPSDPDKDYWVDNFDNAHYTQMLFDKTSGANSLANYYLAQSDGKFTVDGGVYGWVKLPYPESFYGADAGDGTDNANGPAWRIVQDTIKAAQEQGIEIPYKNFDADGDGYVDSLMVIHAGAGQEGGGGAQGDDAIWSHSWFVDYAHEGVKTNDGTWVGPYTIEPEDGAVGVFAHEYGHQLGLPDLYDTTYIGESSTGFYTLMSSGSWTGKPLGTQPANLDIWSKMVLGWTPDLTEVYQGQSGIKDFLIHSDETYATFSKGFRINLPQHAVTTDINTPFEGSNEYWSTMGDNLSTTMTRTVDLSGVPSATLNFKTWYQIEYDYDYGFVEVSTDNGATFTKIPGNITRDIGNGVPGVDGFSNGWVDASYDLSAYAGQSIQLRFHYLTDGGLAYDGWTIDQITIPEIGYSDNAESQSDWAFNGFRQFAGKETQMKAHYYMGQLVRPYATNEGLNQVYNYYGSQMERFEYQPGVLLWYRDTAYVDNNVGLHPGQGRLLLVDSHNAPLMQANGRPFRTRVQVWDAPFGLAATPPLTLHGSDLVPVEFPSQAPVSVFDGLSSYYNDKAPYNSVITPQYGLKLYVKGVSSDGSAARIGIDYK